MLEISRRRLIDNLRELIDQFTLEEKQESAFVFLLRSLGLNPMMLNPYGWASIRFCNTIEDLGRSAPQSRAAIA